jgi:Zn-dependent protease with chaperone function
LAAIEAKATKDGAKKLLTITEFKSLLKGNRTFWVKRAVTALVPGSVYLLFGGPSLLIRLVGGIIFLFSAPASASWFIVGFFVEPVMFSVRFRKSVLVEDEDYAWIVKMSGVKTKNRMLKLVKGLDNAFTNKMTRTICFGEDMYGRQSREDRQITIGHEAGHLVAPILTPRTAALLGAGILLLVIVTSVVHDFLATEIVGMSVMYLITVPVRWETEYAADRHACRLFGPRAVIAALERLVPPNRAGLDTDSHPSINRRIQKIKKEWNLS